MVKLVYPPQWFYGKDIAIDLVSIIVLVLVALYSAKSYKLGKKRNYLYLAFSFCLLAASFVFKILMNLNIYYKYIETQNLGAVTEIYHSLKASNNLFITSFFLYWFLTLFGFYILYTIYQKQSVSNFLLGTYLLLISTYFMYPNYHVFFLTLIVILALISINQFRKYINNKFYMTKYVACSFGTIAIGQVFFVLVDVNSHFYVAGELIQLLGYIGLLATFIMVLRHGRKEIKNRHHN